MLGRDAAFVSAVIPWDPELVTLRACGVIPIARQYPGFVSSHKKECLAESLRVCREILDGTHDDVPTEAFSFTGGIDETRSQRKSPPVSR